MRTSCATLWLVLALAGCGGPQGVHESDTDTQASTGGSESSAGPDVDPCSGTTIGFGEFFQISEANVGALRAADLDGDEDLDLVGSEGWMLIQDGESLEATAVVGFSGAFARPGRVHSGAKVDLVARGADSTEILVYPEPALGGGPPVSTVVTDFWAYALGDATEDGLDDLALMTANGASVELWAAMGDGSFVQVAAVPVNAPPTAITLADLAPNTGPELDLVVADTEAIHLFPGDGTGTFGAPTQIVQPWVWYVAGADVLEGDRPALVLSYSITQLEQTNAVGVVEHPNDEWTGSFIDLPASPYEFGWGDIAGTGRSELGFVSRTDPGSLDILCSDDGETVLGCAHADLPHMPSGVAILPEIDQLPPRVVYSSEADGVWMAELTADDCAYRVPDDGP